MFKEKFKSFMQQFDDDKIHANLDENSMSISIGCDLNHIEAERVRTLLKNGNPSYKICTIHTCTAYNEFIELTKKVIDFVRDNLPVEYSLILTGCGADSFKSNYPDIKIVSDKDKFDINQYGIDNITNNEYIEKPIGLIQIQTGCNNQCSYCLFPKLKGHHSVSKTKQEILDLIKYNCDSGVKEITLTGVNICQYCDPNDNTDLIDLLRFIIDSKVGIKEISLYSIDPAYDRVFDLIDLIESEPLLRKSLYLATQSGSDSVLKKMNRRHTSSRIKDILKYVKTVKIRHDFIVGHPGETEDDFNESLKLLRLSQENDLVGGIAEFYAHEGTASYYMKDKVSESDCKRRYNKMKDTLNKILTIINQPVKCLQFELWHNCSNCCSFCYLNTNRILYTEKQKQEACQYVIDNIDKYINGYNAVGFIGGELFGDQLVDKNTYQKFIDMIQKVKTYLDEDVIKEVWLTSNLITNDLNPLINTLNILMKDKPKYQRILVCTSYDTCGRFKSEKDYEQWLNNVNKIHELFPDVLIHLECITTQRFIDEWLNNRDKFKKFLDTGFLMDFKPPNITAWNYTKEIHDLNTYRQYLEEFAETQFDGYLIESRSKFLEFCESVYKLKDGYQRLKDFASNEVESEKLYSIPWNIWYETRWISKEENAPCGHRWDGHTYVHEPEKCCKCDIEKLLKVKK